MLFLSFRGNDDNRSLFRFLDDRIDCFGKDQFQGCASKVLRDPVKSSVGVVMCYPRPHRK